MTGHQFRRTTNIPILDPTPPCVGYATWFDDPAFGTVAREVCIPCPHRVACLQIVDPARSWYDGTVGGHTFVNGHTEIDGDPVLATYLERVEMPSERNRNHAPYDPAVVQRLVDGTLGPGKASNKERRAAAKQLIAQGTPLAEITRRIGMGHRLLTELINEIENEATLT